MIKLVPTTALRKALNRINEFLHMAGGLSRLEKISLFLALTAIIYLASVAVEYGIGWSASEPVPERLIRLQIVDGAGDDGGLQEAGKLFTGDRAGSAEFRLVGREKFTGRILPETILIARGDRIEDAERLARFLGLDNDRIISKPLENDEHSIGVTLVLGEDFRSAVLDEIKEKETHSSS